MLQYNGYIGPILFSYIIGGFILTLSIMPIGTPRFFSKLNSWFLFSICYSLIGIFMLHSQRYVLPHILSMNIIIFLLIRVFYSNPAIKAFCISLYMIAISICAELICICFFRTFLSLEAYSDFDGNNLYMLVGITFTNMSLLLLTASFPAIWCIIKSYRHTREIFLYSLFPVYQFISFCTCMYLFKKPSLQMVYVGNIFLILGILIDIILLASLDNLIKYKKHQDELKILTNQQVKEYDYYLHIQNQLNRHRIIKHEFANQISTIYAMLSNHVSTQKINEMIDISNHFLQDDSFIERNDYNDTI